MVTIAITVIGVVGSVLAVYQFAEERRRRRRFGWRDVDKLVLRLLKTLEHDEFDPDLVLGVGRGGAIVAGMLAGNLGQLPLVCIDTESKRDRGRKQCVIRFPSAVPVLRDKRVLIVVGELYSGEDMRTAMDFVVRRKPESFKTLSLLSHPASVVRPDFVGLETKVPLSAPWRLTENYKNNRI
jgi:hypoxanthine phosphoribosyltransferase